jgi:hypothetical protein
MRGVDLMSSHRLDLEVGALARVVLEAMFQLMFVLRSKTGRRPISEWEKRALDIVEAQTLESAKAYGIWKQHRYNAPGFARLAAEMAPHVRRRRGKNFKLNVEELAKQAGIHDTYDLFYRAASFDAHASLDANLRAISPGDRALIAERSLFTAIVAALGVTDAGYRMIGREHSVDEVRDEVTSLLGMPPGFFTKKPPAR